MQIQKNQGQIVVEYLLLLVVGVALAALLIKQLASRDPEKPGMIVQKWDQIIQAIGADTID